MKSLASDLHEALQRKNYTHQDYLTNDPTKSPLSFIFRGKTVIACNHTHATTQKYFSGSMDYHTHPDLGYIDSSKEGGKPSLELLKIAIALDFDFYGIISLIIKYRFELLLKSCLENKHKGNSNHLLSVVIDYLEETRSNRMVVSKFFDGIYDLNDLWERISFTPLISHVNIRDETWIVIKSKYGPADYTLFDEGIYLLLHEEYMQLFPEKEIFDKDIYGFVFLLVALIRNNVFEISSLDIKGIRSIVDRCLVNIQPQEKIPDSIIDNTADLIERIIEDRIWNYERKRISSELQELFYPLQVTADSRGSEILVWLYPKIRRGNLSICCVIIYEIVMDRPKSFSDDIAESPPIRNTLADIKRNGWHIEQVSLNSITISKNL